MEMEFLVASNVICTGLLIFFVKNFLPKYFEQKASNLATKEDIKEITQITESVKQEFNKQMEIFSTQNTFQHNFSYERYAKLYSYLYGYIVQSEYAREFLEVSKISPIFEEVPFVEIKTRVTATKLSDGVFQNETRNEETQFDEHKKNRLYQTIIDNSEYASQKLLKLAFSYKIASHYYGDANQNHVLNEKANCEELRLIYELVVCIVKEYNQLRKTLEMSYSQQELETGQVKLSIPSENP